MYKKGSHRRLNRVGFRSRRFRRRCRIIGPQCFGEFKHFRVLRNRSQLGMFFTASGPSLGTHGSASAGSQLAGLVLDTWPFGVQIEAQQSIKRAPF
jgi:hypothetical protein